MSRIALPGAAPADTSADAWEAQLAMLRRLGGEERIAMAFGLTRLAREAARSGIRARHPEYGGDEVRRAFFRMLHGDAATLSTWPDRVAGSVASSHHGRPRATNDADVVIDPTSEALERLETWAETLGIADLWRQALETSGRHRME